MTSFLSKKTIVLALIVIIIAAFPSLYFYNKYQKTQQLLKNPNQVNKEEIKSLVSKVGKLLELPQGEEPTVATVSDVKKLKDQPFFAKAQNGDKVLIYTNAKKAILYRPSTNKIIEVAPINLGASQISQTVKVALYNGTTTIGLTKTVEKDLTSKVANLEIVTKENANKNNYSKTIVVDISGNNKTVADNIAKALGGEIGTLPNGETKPNADILIIIGSNYIQR